MMWSSLNGWSLSNLCSVCPLRWIIHLPILPYSVRVHFHFIVWPIICHKAWFHAFCISIMTPMLFLSVGVWISKLLPNCSNSPRGDDDWGMHSDQRILRTSLPTSEPRQPWTGPVKKNRQRTKGQKRIRKVKRLKNKVVSKSAKWRKVLKERTHLCALHVTI